MQVSLLFFLKINASSQFKLTAQDVPNPFCRPMVLNNYMIVCFANDTSDLCRML